MAQVLETVARIASIVASFGVLVPPAVVAAGFVVLPRAAPLRALVLGASSKIGFLRPAFTASQRTAECQALEKLIGAHSSAQVVIVTGPMGVGKTRVIDTVAAELPGVVRVRVTAGASEDEIVGKALKAVTRFHLTPSTDVSRAARVITWHKRFFRVPPTVILDVPQRYPYEKPAPMGPTVRQLVDEHKLRVIVDFSDCSLDLSVALLTTTERRRVLSVGLIERDVLESFPEFQGLLTALKTAGVADLVWGVLGGNPASYDLLKTHWVIAGSPLGAEDVVTVAEEFVAEKLMWASITLNKAKARRRDLVGPVYEQFKTVDELPASILEDRVLPTLDKVLRLIAEKGHAKGVLVPISPAMALVMRHGVKGEPPSLEVVRKALGTN